MGNGFLVDKSGYYFIDFDKVCKVIIIVLFGNDFNYIRKLLLSSLNLFFLVSEIMIL